MFFLTRFKSAARKESDSATSSSEASPLAKVLSPKASDSKKSKLPQVAMTRGSEDAFFDNIKEGQKEVAKSTPNPTHIKRLLQVYI